MTQKDTFDGVDLDTFDNTEFSGTHRVPVLFTAEGAPKSGFIIVGKDSKQYQETELKLRAESLQRSANRQSQIDGSTEEGAMIIARRITETRVRLANAVIVGWFGFGRNGEEAPFDSAVALQMLNRFPTWRDRISDALEVDTNFLPS